MDPAIRLALTWTILAIAVVMTGFTILDVASGSSTTALWIGLGAWPVVAFLAGWIIRKSGPA